MSEAPDSLEHLAQKLAGLDKEREDYITWFKGRGYQVGERVVFTDIEGTAKQKRFNAVQEEIEALRPRYTAKLLTSLEASSKRLEDTSKSQVTLTTNLERAERLIGALTGALLLLTGILAVVGAGSYALQTFANIGYSGQILNDWAFLVQMIVLAIVVIGFLLILRMVRRPRTNSNPRTHTDSMSSDDMPRKTIYFLVIAAILILVFAVLLDYPTNAELSAGRLTTYYALLALGIALLFGAAIEVRFGQIRAQLGSLERRLEATKGSSDKT